jgi:hypothetical protein
MNKRSFINSLRYAYYGMEDYKRAREQFELVLRPGA